MSNSDDFPNLRTKTMEVTETHNEKAEKLNGRLAMLGVIAALVLTQSLVKLFLEYGNSPQRQRCGSVLSRETPVLSPREVSQGRIENGDSNPSMSLLKPWPRLGLLAEVRKMATKPDALIHAKESFFKTRRAS